MSPTGINVPFSINILFRDTSLIFFRFMIYDLCTRMKNAGSRSSSFFMLSNMTNGDFSSSRCSFRYLL